MLTKDELDSGGLDAGSYNTVRENFQGNVGMMKALSVCHGSKLLFERKFAKSRVVGF